MTIVKSFFLLSTSILNTTSTTLTGLIRSGNINLTIEWPDRPELKYYEQVCIKMCGELYQLFDIPKKVGKV